MCQDIDRVAALMCYIQLSLLGCSGYVVVGNSLTNPTISLYGNPLLPIEREGQEIWCMPMFHDQVWVYRQAIAKMGGLITAGAKTEVSEAVRKIPATQPDLPVKSEKCPDLYEKCPTTQSEPEPEQFTETETGQLTFF